MLFVMFFKCLMVLLQQTQDLGIEALVFFIPIIIAFVFGNVETFGAGRGMIVDAGDVC